MKDKEKSEIMSRFYAGDIDVLVATSVIEVGIDSQRASIMAVMDSDRFGLAALHQLRGRVGRNDLQSYCILVSNYDKERLQILTKVSDGFQISEEDFKLRGSGDFFGNRQSGDMSFQIASIYHDFPIFKHAREDVIAFLENPVYLDQEEKERFVRFQKNIVNF